MPGTSRRSRRARARENQEREQAERVFRDAVAPYDRDVIEHLAIKSENIPTKAIGVEIELHFGKEVSKHTEMYDNTGGVKGLTPMNAGQFIVSATHRALRSHGISAVAKWDGSIGVGFELALAPVPFSKVKDIAAAYGDLLRMGGKANCRCGLHVHVNRHAFVGWDALSAWCWLWSRPGVVHILSGRSKERLERWANPATVFPLWANGRHAQTLLYRYHEHHSSVCLRRNETAELRVFAAPTNERSAAARIELTVATVEYVVAVCAMGRRETICWLGFLLWLDEHREEYQNTYAYILRGKHKIVNAPDIEHTVPERNMREPEAATPRIRGALSPADIAYITLPVCPGEYEEVRINVNTAVRLFAYDPLRIGELLECYPLSSPNRGLLFRQRDQPGAMYTLRYLRHDRPITLQGEPFYPSEHEIAVTSPIRIRPRGTLESMQTTSVIPPILSNHLIEFVDHAIEYALEPTLREEPQPNAEPEPF